MSTRPGTWTPWVLTAITPVFLGAADISPVPQPDPDHAQSPPTVHVPVASLRGELRYWLRALIGAHVGNDLAALRAAERYVFGAAAAADDPSRGQSPVQMRATAQMRVVPAVPEGGQIPDTTDWLPLRRGGRAPSFSGAAYLLGQGLYQPGAKQFLRGYVAPETRIELAARIRTNPDRVPAVSDLFLAALWAFQVYGGSGARARRGLGTVAVTQAPALNTGSFDPGLLARDSHQDLTTVLTHVRDALQVLGVRATGATDELPLYPCFAPGRYLHAEWDLTASQGMTEGPMADALQATGEHLRAFRVHGDPWERSGLRKHTAEYDKTVEQFLTEIFGIAGPAPYLADPTEPFRAGALGLPAGYGDRHGPPPKTRRSAVVAPFLDGKELRRASPLWLRPKPPTKASKPWRLRSLVFLCQWLPDGATLEVSFKRKRRAVLAPTQTQVEDRLRMWFPAATSTTSRR